MSTTAKTIQFPTWSAAEWTDDITEAWSSRYREGADAQAYLLERFQ